MSVVVEHVRENVLCVFQTLRHLSVVAFKSLVERKRGALSLLIDVSDEAAFRVQQNFSMILEADLHDLVTEAEHDRMLCPHPLLHIHDGQPLP